MRYQEIIGQTEVKSLLRRMQKEGRMPHALLFAGPDGCGKLSVALALAQALLCETPVDAEACNACHACRMTRSWVHPDLHFVFPTAKKKGQKDEAVSDRYLKEWRELLSVSAYVGWNDWLKKLGVENQQPVIGVADSNEIIRKLSIKASQGGRKVVIIWHAELLNLPAANKLLKILEEPPADTVFILLTSRPGLLLDTILSRTQRIDFRPLSETEIASALELQRGLSPEDAKLIAHTAEGNFTKAVAALNVGEESSEYFELFSLIMRKCYSADIREMYRWAELLASWGRERQKSFLDYCLRLVRENFVYNFRRPEINYMSRLEADFALRFARFIHERNVIGFMELFDEARRDIAQNVNAHMVFFDMAMNMAVLIRK